MRRPVGGIGRQTFERDPLSVLRVPLPIDIVQLQTTASTAFTATNDFQITHLVATNVTGSADYVTIYMVPDGGSAGASTTIVYQKAVPANSGVTIFDQNNQGLLQPLMTLQALCGTNDAVNLWGHGYDYQGARD